MIGRTYRAAVATLLLAVAACNTRHPADVVSPAAPTPVPAPTPAPVPSPIPTAPLPVVALGIDFAPRAVIGGNPVTATATLVSRAPAGGAVLTLSSDDSSAIVPPTVMIPEGSDRANFPIATRAVSDDHSINIRASVAGSTAGNVLPVWSNPPTSLWYISSDSGDFVASGRVGHMTSPKATFTVNSFTHSTGFASLLVDAPAGDPSLFWLIDFSSADGSPLAVGVYDDPGGPTVHPGFNIGGYGHGCSTVNGRFEIREIQFGPDAKLTRLDVAFDQHCNNSPSTLHLELRFNATR